MKYIKWGFFLVLLLAALAASAQNQNNLLLLEEDLEELAMESEEVNWEDELEELSHRLQEPVNLNTATREQLEQFPFLTDTQVENLLAYLYIEGPMQTLYELQLVEGMDRTTIERLSPFVCVKPVEVGKSFPSWEKLWKYGKHEILTRMDVPFYTRKGYEKAYLGPSLYHSLRYGFRYGDYLQVGVAGEKDAGEPFFALHDRKGYDHYSYYLLLKNYKRLKTLALGTYRLSFGEGLVLGNSFGLGKSFSIATTRYRSGGIRKHGSTDEYNYFRGAAATVQLVPRWQVSAFYSHRTLDGVVEEGVITSIYKTGLHRTQQEADKMRRLSLQTAGGRVAYEGRSLRVGMTGIYYFFNRMYEPTLRPYARYNLHGNRFYNAGIDYAWLAGRFSWTGEAALGKHGYALLNRLQYNLSSDYRLLLLHRYYSHDYWALYAHSFGEGSAVQNENGWYVAAEASPWAGWRFFVSGDFFSFPWWRYRISKPSQGMELRAQAFYAPKETLSMYLNYRYKQRERDVTGTGGKVTTPTYHHRLRYRLNYRAGVLTLRTTVDYNHFRQQDGEGYRFNRRQGWQCTQLAGYTLLQSLSLFLQGTYFHTDDYDSRVYAYEPGLLYTFYTPSFSGRGFRYSARVRWEWRNRIMLLAKIGQTLYQDRNEIGSGNDLITDNKKTDLQLQVRVKF